MKKYITKIKEIFESNTILKVIYCVGIIGIAFLIFRIGVFVGEKKEAFKNAWRDHYMENFDMSSRPNFNSQKIDTHPNSHGAIGKIISVQLPTILVSDKNSVEKSIEIDSDAKIINGNETITAQDLKVNDFVVIIGLPNDKGQIDAKFIRIIPSPETLPGTSIDANKNTNPLQ